MDQAYGNFNQKPPSGSDEPEDGFQQTGAGERRRNHTSANTYKQTKKRRKQTSAIVIDLCIAALILFAFYMVNYGLPSRTQGKTLTESAGAGANMQADAGSKGGSGAKTATAAPEQTAAPTPKPTVDPTPWRVKFADKFTSGAVQQTELSYQDANVNIRIDKVQKDDLVYFFADIYIADIQY